MAQSGVAGCRSRFPRVLLPSQEYLGDTHPTRPARGISPHNFVWSYRRSCTLFMRTSSSKCCDALKRRGRRHSFGHRKGFSRVGLTVLITVVWLSGPLSIYPDLSPPSLSRSPLSLPLPPLYSTTISFPSPGLPNTIFPAGAQVRAADGIASIDSRPSTLSSSKFSTLGPANSRPTILPSSRYLPSNTSPPSCVSN